MKRTDELSTKRFSILVLTVLLHYLILNYFFVSTPEVFIGKVKDVKKVQLGLFPQLIVSFEINPSEVGSKNLEKRIVKVVQSGAIKLLVGKTYIVKTHKDWLCTYSKS